MEQQSLSSTLSVPACTVQWSVDGNGLVIDDPNSSETSAQGTADEDDCTREYKKGYSRLFAHDRLYGQNPLEAVMVGTAEGDTRWVRILYGWMLDILSDTDIGEYRQAIPRSVVIFERCCSSSSALSWIRQSRLQSFYLACFFIAIKYEFDDEMNADYCTMLSDYSTTIPELLQLERVVFSELGMDLNDRVIEHALFDHGIQSEVERFLAVECWIQQRIRWSSSDPTTTVPFYKKRLSEQYEDAIREAHAILHNYSTLCPTMKPLDSAAPHVKPCLSSVTDTAHVPMSDDVASS
jgi:hypothetical protein